MKHPPQEVALVSQCQLIGALIQDHLATCPGLTLAWRATNRPESLRLCALHPPTVLIISSIVQGSASLEIITSIRRKHPDIKILVFAGVLFPELTSQFFARDVHGIVSATSPPDTLDKAIESLLKGDRFFAGIAASLLQLPKDAPLPLTTRETSVLRLIAEGFSLKEAAEELHIGVKSAGKFRERIMAKLNLHDSVKLTRYAIRNGIAPLD